MSIDPETLARAFHEAYERLAPAHGYATREGSRVPWEQVPENNRALMVATATDVIESLRLACEDACPLCGGGPGLPETCPYAADVHDREVACGCCRHCRASCAADV